MRRPNEPYIWGSRSPGRWPGALGIAHRQSPPLVRLPTRSASSCHRSGANGAHAASPSRHAYAGGCFDRQSSARVGSPPRARYQSGVKSGPVTSPAPPGSPGASPGTAARPWRQFPGRGPRTRQGPSEGPSATPRTGPPVLPPPPPSPTRGATNPRRGAVGPHGPRFFLLLSLLSMDFLHLRVQEGNTLDHVDHLGPSEARNLGTVREKNLDHLDHLDHF